MISPLLFDRLARQRLEERRREAADIALAHGATAAPAHRGRSRSAEGRRGGRPDRSAWPARPRAPRRRPAPG